LSQVVSLLTCHMHIRTTLLTMWRGTDVSVVQ